MVIAHDQRIQDLRHHDIHKLLKTTDLIHNIQPLQIRGNELFTMDLALPG